MKRNVYRRLKRRLLRLRNRRRSVSAVCKEIYRNNAWGGRKAELDSGGGTGDAHIVNKYVRTITKSADTELFCGLRFLDLGCGDFRTGSRLVNLAGHYTGADVLGPLIKPHQETHSREGIEFRVLDIIAEELPDADVSFIRQVMQHLSNTQIQQILPKLAKFKLVIITGHLCMNAAAAVPNLDKMQGMDIRLMRNSGVYIKLLPFSLPASALTHVLEVKTPEFREPICESGILRTTLYRPARS